MQQVLEVGDIAGKGKRIEVYLCVIGDQRRAFSNAGRLELVSEGIEGDAEAGASRILRAIRPELLDQCLPRMGTVAIESQVSQQGGGLLGAKTGDRILPSKNLETAG